MYLAPLMNVTPTDFHKKIIGVRKLGSVGCRHVLITL